MSAKKARAKRGGERPGDVPMDSPPSGGSTQVGRVYFRVGAALSFLLSISFYLRTVAASSSFWDAGEFISTSYIMGIPHSPGTPLYVLVGRVFSLLPFPASVASKVNFISVLCGALGVLFVYLLIVRFADHILGKSTSNLDSLAKAAGGLAGALFLTFSDTYWTNAIEAEVYAMSCFLMGFMTWLGLKWEERPNVPKATALIYLLFYLLALSVGFHLGTILAFSGIFFLVFMTKSKPFSNLEFIIACLGVGIFISDATLYREGGLTLFAIIIFAGLLVYLYSTRSPFAAICTALFLMGLSVHFYLLIRSGHNPAIDEGNPETWKALYAVLRREQYPPMNVFARKASFLFQLQHFNRYFQNQFEMASLYMGSLNVGSMVPIALGLWGMADHYSRDKKTFVMLFVTLLITSLGLIVFLNFSDHEVRERDYFYSPAFYYFAIFIGIGAASLLVEAKGFAERRGLGSAPVTYGLVALLLALPAFTAKRHFFTHDRSRNYVCRDYAVNMLIALERDAIIFTNGDNDTFPLWFIQEVENYRKDVRVVNLSLLNTPWYIKQLKDNEPKLPIKWSDEQIEQLTPVRTKNGWLLVRDLAVRHILRENRWQRPIYFAVTIPPETFSPYRDYLEMEGLAFRLVPKKGKNMINAEKLERNVMKKYSYRSILDENWKRDHSIYLPRHTEHLIQNYSAAFCQLAFLKYRQKKIGEAVRAMETAQEISPNIDPVVLWLGWYYLENGDTTKAIDHYKRQIKRHPEIPDLLYRLAGVYERVGDFERALFALDELVSRGTGDRDAVLSAFGLAMKLGLPQRARNYIVSWLDAHPDDGEVRRALEELSALEVRDSSRGIGEE